MTLLLLAAFVQQSDLTDLILHFLLSRKSAAGKPFLVLFYFLFAGFIASILSHCLAVLIIFLELFKEMMRKSDIKPYTRAADGVAVQRSALCPPAYRQPLADVRPLPHRYEQSSKKLTHIQPNKIW